MQLNKIIIIFISLLNSNNNLSSYRELVEIYKQNSIDTTLININEIIDNERNLATIGKDIYGRNVMMCNKSTYYWSLLDSAAKKNNIKLLIVSAYRSYSYQANIIKRKRDSGKTLAEILRENELPGYSEHHSGRAIDLTNDSIKTLSEDFKNTEEYKWLINNAHLYNFYLTYPENNPYKKFEPWHWCYKEKN